MKPEKQIRTSFRLPANLHRRLRIRAAETGKKLQILVSLAIQEMLDKKEEEDNASGE